MVDLCKACGGVPRARRRGTAHLYGGPGARWCTCSERERVEQMEAEAAGLEREAREALEGFRRADEKGHEGTAVMWAVEEARKREKAEALRAQVPVLRMRKART